MPPPDNLKQPFSPGPIPVAGLTILKRVPDAKKARSYGDRWNYLIEYACCGANAVIQHATIAERVERNTRRCRACATLYASNKKDPNAYKTQSYDYDKWVTPPWPVPPLLQERR